MDTISHAFAGSILARTIEDRTAAWAALVLGAAAAAVPDLDFLMISKRIEYLREHRGWTHSFVVLPFLALGLALLMKPFARRVPLGRLWLFAAIGVQPSRRTSSPRTSCRTSSSSTIRTFMVDPA